MCSNNLTFTSPDYRSIMFDDIKSSNDGDVCIAYITNELIKNSFNPVCIDIGADIAAWSLLCKNINTTSILYTFEPNPKSYESIKKYESSTLKIFNKGVSDKNGSAYMEFDGGQSSMRNNTGTLIETTTINFIFDIHNSIDLIKIDTEGHDITILNSLTDYYSKIKSIVFEFTVYWYGKTANECFNNSIKVLMKLYNFYKYIYIVSRNHRPRLVVLDTPETFMSIIKVLYFYNLQVDILVTNSEIKTIEIRSVDEMFANCLDVLF